MPLLFWFPMIILGGMLDVAAYARRSGRESPGAGSRPRLGQGPMRSRRAHTRTRGRSPAGLKLHGSEGASHDGAQSRH
jgi:hypothetical protein